MKQTRLYTLAVTVLCLLLVTCKSADTPHTLLHVNFKLKAGSSDFSLNTNYTLQGKLIQFTTVRFYVCQFSYKTPLGNGYTTLDSLYHIVEPGNTVWTIPVKNNITLDRIQFGMGVDVTRNDSSGALAIPAYDYPADHPLSASQNMYWSWNPGYIFMKLEGRVDLNGNSSLNDPGETFSLHTGLNNAFRIVNKDVHIPLGNESEKNIYIEADIFRFFDNYDLPNQLNAHPTNTSHPEYVYVEELVENIQAVFSPFYQ